MALQTDSRLLEREPFVDVLETAYGHTRAGHGRLVLVSGESGGGKTVLFRYFCAERAAGSRLLWGACDALFTPRPLGPIHDIAQDAGSDFRELVRTEVIPYHVATALARDLRENGPTVLVLEDVHQADEATLRDEAVPPSHTLRIDGVFGRLCGAMEMPELASDPRFATHFSRGENQEAIEAIVREWAVERDFAEIDRVLADAGVICGPIYTIADIFADEHFWAREMLVKHIDPGFGEYVGPGIVPKFSETPGAVRWSGTWEEGSHNQDVYGGLLGLPADEIEQLKAEGVL